jgi:predicted phage terminase large subunit-like protein
MPTEDSLKIVAARLNLQAFTEQLGYNNAPFHIEWYNRLENQFSPLKTYPNRQKLLLQFWPRGHGKTTCNINYLSWLIGNYPDIHINLVSKTAAQAESILLALMTRFESDEKYINIMGELKPKQPKKWTTQELIVNRNEISKNPTIQACGLMGPITGRRADLNLCDDIIDEENVRSPLQLEKALTWHDKVLAPTLYPWGGEIVTGTRWHYADLYAEFIKRKPQSVDIKRAIINEEKHEVLWPEYWSYPKLVEKRSEIGSIIFSCQYDNDPTSMEGSLLKGCWLHPWNDVDPSFNPPSSLPVYAGIDPSLGENDFFGVSSFAFDALNRKGYLLDVWAEHMPFPTIARVKFPQLHTQYNYRKIFIEANFWQKLLLKFPEFQTHPETKKPYPMVPIQTVKNKEERFIPMSSHFESKRVLVNPLLLNRGEFWTQWVQFPRGQHDDAIDCVDLVVSNVLSRGPFQALTGKSLYG